MAEYLIIATYRDNEQRYATTVTADSPEEAAVGAQVTCAQDNDCFDPNEKPLLIAGVLLNGEVVG